MGKRELKKQYKEFDFSIIDFMSRFDVTENNKLTPFLMKMFEKRLEEDKRTLKKASIGGPTPSERIVKPKNLWENILRNNITEVFLDGNGNVELLERFAQHLGDNRIDDTDINNYDSWEDISRAVSKADMKYMEKELVKEIEVIYQDDTWLFLKPLSLKASQTYGMGTKWCTSMKHNESYFYRYSNNGILVYTINKKTGRKFGFYSSQEEFSVWDEKDRRVDSLESRIPAELLGLIRTATDLSNPKNGELFSEEEKRNMEKYISKKMDMDGMDLDMGDEEVMEMEMAPVDMAMDMEMAEETMEDDGFNEARNEIVAPPPSEPNEDWEPRSADYAFGNVGAEMPQPVMEAEPMLVTEDEVMEAPANVPLEVINDEVYDEYDGEPDVAGVMDL